jgi:hypothetical protein
MTRDEIIRMMRSVCDKDKVDAWQCDFWTITQEELERFAALVAAAEREACISIVEEYEIPIGNSAAGEIACEMTYGALKEIRDAIRARRQS